jgi:hypothetical protein
MKKSVLTLLLILSISVLTGCGGESSKVERTLNAQFIKDEMCTNVPVGAPVDMRRIGEDGALGLLMSNGYIAQTKGTYKKWSGGIETVDTFSLTEKGKELVKSGNDNSQCLKTGHFEIVKIQAVDIGNDAEGKKIATVRASVKFVPESWVSDTKKEKAWDGFWKSVSDNENGQWLYQLVKSGDEFFPAGRGHKVSN